MPLPEIQLQRRLAENPGDAHAWYQLGTLLYGKCHVAQASWRMGVCSEDVYALAFAESRQALEHAVRLAPEEARGWVALASLLVELEERADYDTDALVALDRAVLLNPEDARAWYMRAQLCERRDDRTGALNSLTRALALDEARRGDARWDFGDLSGEPGFRELMGD